MEKAGNASSTILLITAAFHAGKVYGMGRERGDTMRNNLQITQVDYAGRNVFEESESVTRIGHMCYQQKWTDVLSQYT